MGNFICQRCGIETKSTLEVFAYNRYIACDDCQKLFFDIVDRFFEPSKQKDYVLHFKCDKCNKVDLVFREKAESWECICK